MSCERTQISSQSYQQGYFLVSFGVMGIHVHYHVPTANKQLKCSQASFGLVGAFQSECILNLVSDGGNHSDTSTCRLSIHSSSVTSRLCALAVPVCIG